MNKKRIVFTVFGVAGLALAVVYGQSSSGRRATDSLGDLDSDVRSMTDAYALVEKNFADPIPVDRAFYQGVIPGMLGTLDPHSTFLTPVEYADMQRKQRAQYSGVGMLIRTDLSVNGKTVAIEPFPGSPAQQAGFRRGDAILTIDGKDATHMSSTEVADNLRGPRGTKVTVTIERVGAPAPITLTVTRGEITTSVVDAYWLQPGIMYLGVQSFEAQNLAKDVENFMAKLGESDVKGLVIDLRENPGGLVTEAVSLAGRFLKDGQVVVSDHGRSVREQIYRAKAVAKAQDYPIVVLVNRHSASASEIVSGALQDHDRAWVMGESTFGKGLVQAQFPLSENAALLLTIAHYYTPSGRLIQRDYTNQSFFDYYNSRKEAGQPSQTDIKSTDSGRRVYGGGGITPDETYAPAASNAFQGRMVGTQAVFHFGNVYFNAAQPILPSNNWVPDEDAISRFKTYLKSQDIKFTDEELAANRKWVGDQLRLELLQRAYDVKTATRTMILDDPEVHKAIEAMPKAQSLLNRRGPTQRAALGQVSRPALRP